MGVAINQEVFGQPNMDVIVILWILAGLTIIAIILSYKYKNLTYYMLFID
jgi:hypothetical protein